MHHSLTPIDISHSPDLLRIAEEVRVTKTPRILQRDQETLAVVMPVANTLLEHQEDIWQHYDAKRVHKALKTSTGALAGVNRDQLFTDIAQERNQESRGRSR